VKLVAAIGNPPAARSSVCNRPAGSAVVHRPRRHAVPSGIGDARPYCSVAGRAGAVVLVSTALLRRVR